MKFLKSEPELIASNHCPVNICWKFFCLFLGKQRHISVSVWCTYYSIHKIFEPARTDDKNCLQESSSLHALCISCLWLASLHDDEHWDGSVQNNAPSSVSISKQWLIPWAACLFMFSELFYVSAPYRQSQYGCRNLFCIMPGCFLYEDQKYDTCLCVKAFSWSSLLKGSKTRSNSCFISKY